MKFTISKSYTFEAAHHLNGLPHGHKCARDHGHSYTVIVGLSSKALDEVGFVVDFAFLDSIIKPLVETLDHNDLNVLFTDEAQKKAMNPTAEHIAMWFWRQIEVVVHAQNQDVDPETWVNVAFVEVQETAKCSARVEA